MSRQVARDPNVPDYSVLVNGVLHYRCPDCGAVTPALTTHHPEDCSRRQLAAARISISEWKEAWHRQREIIGETWWWGYRWRRHARGVEQIVRTLSDRLLRNGRSK